MKIITKIDTGNLSIDDYFSIAIYCSKLLSTGNSKDEMTVRKIAIHILNNWEQMPSELYPIWTDIIESVGFYPYIEKNANTMKMLSLSDEVRQKSFLSDYLPSMYLHKEQKKLSMYLLSGKNVIASAPTSFGKSLLIEELIASQKYKNIVIIQPTLALLDETRIKLKKYNNAYKIIVRTSQLPTTEKGNLFLLTAERVMEYDPLPHIDLLVIDEFYKLSLKRTDERANTLNNAFLKIVGKYNSKFYLLGPNIDGITPGFAEKYNAEFYKSDFSLVDCNVIDLSNRFNFSLSSRSLDKEKLPLLYDLLDQLINEQTLIYCSTPARARRFAKGYLEHLSKRGQLPNLQLPLIEWINKNVNPNWSLSKELGYGIAIHDGSLQKHIGTSIIKYFNDGLLHCIFCTSTIIEGVNTSAKNVILFDGQKGGNPIDFFDYSNIKGRSGRLMEHYVGTIYNFVPTPQKESIVIDIPFYEQDKEILSDEILINIEKSDVQQQVIDRYNQLYEITPELMKIIKKNGTNVNGQMNIYYALQRDINTSKYHNIAWSQIPNWDKLLYILRLAENNIFNFESKHAVFSCEQLTRYIHIYRKNKNIMLIIKDIYDTKVKKFKKITEEQKSAQLDNAIEAGFHIYRHWFQFIVPKVFRVIDSLQRYVCEQHGKNAGSYSYFVQQLENDFIQENLSILIEYGIPSNTVHRLADKIPSELDEDDVIEFIKQNKDTLYSTLLQYEIDRLNDAL